MDRENVTISLPAPLVKEAKHLAVDRGVSLSRLVGMLLEEHLQSSHRQREAKDRILARLAHGYDLGLGDRIPWNRDDLHER